MNKRLEVSLDTPGQIPPRELACAYRLKSLERLIKGGDRIAVYCVEYGGLDAPCARYFDVMTFKNYSIFKQVIRDRFPGQIVMTVNYDGLLNDYIIPLAQRDD